MAEPARNLVLVHTEGEQAIGDFKTIAGLVRERAPDIGVSVVTIRHGVATNIAAPNPSRPTLIFSPLPLMPSRAVHGRVAAGRALAKTDEMKGLKAAGLPVPEFALLTPGQPVAGIGWGPLTILKPNVATLGAGVRLVRTRALLFPPPGAPSLLGVGGERPLVAQRYIDSGPHAESWRILTIFGRPLYSSRTRALNPRPDLSGDGSLDGAVASNVMPRIVRLDIDPDVIALAAKAHAAFPDVPVQGVDIVREAGTGKLFVIEINAGWNTWHFSSPFGKKLQAEFGLDYHGQFGGFSVAADALVEAAATGAA
jgi:hypothetical protein